MHVAEARVPIDARTADLPRTTPSRTAITRVALASSIGTVIEWYDFLLYGTAAALIFNRLFFPSFDGTAGTLAALSTFAVGYLARPIGGALFGHFGDTRGRKSMLVVTLVLMGAATFAIGLLPTYAQIGVLAPVLLVLLRLLQGIGLGGEWGAAVLMAIEHAPPRRRGFYGSWPQLGGPAGALLANLAFVAVSSLPEDQFLAWGWRLPFLVSIVLVAVGLVVRRKVGESPVFAQLKQARAEAKQPLLEVIRRHPREVLLAMGARTAEIGSFNFVLIFVLSYAIGTLALPRPSVLLAISVGALFTLIVTPIFGALSDRVGRRPVYLGGAITSMLLAIPACWLIDRAQLGPLLLGMILVTLGAAAMFGPQAAFFAELFGTRVRYTGASLGFQLGAVLAGGLSPVIAASLAASAGDLRSVSLFLIAMGAVSLVCALAMRKPAQA